MFSPRRPPERTASCSTDDHSSAKDTPPRSFQGHYPHDLSMSSQSLDSTHSRHDDLPTPLLHIHASHSPSAQSTPMTSPSTGYSLFHSSLSSATSESVPSMDSKYRSEFGMLIPGSSVSSTMHGSASSRSSNPVSRTWSRSPTESDPPSSAPRIPRKRPSDHFTNRPFTAPNSPLTLATVRTADSSSPADHHSRSHSRLTVSIKNMFTRHAVPSPSRFSLNSTSTPPKSEASADSFQVSPSAGKWSMTPRRSRPPDLEISGTVALATPSPGPASNSPIDVHRRYASDAAARISNTRTAGDDPTGQESIDVSFRNTPSVRGRDPKTRNVLRRRPSGSAKLPKGRERGMSTPSRPNDGDPLPSQDDPSRHGAVPFSLTPAGAVVEAYKQQELHRCDTPSLPKLSIDDRMSATSSHDGRRDRDHLEQSPVPYYTVFGTSSERRIAAGSPDDQWGKFQVDQSIFTSSQPTLLHQPSMSDPGGRTLTRKLSSRWRKAKGGGVAAEDSSLHDKGHSKARPSLQDLWGNDKSSVRPQGRSMDGVSNPADGAWASPSASHARSASKGGDKNEGPILWRLMRRISTGALRDRSQQPDKAVPPVPAIPKELLTKMNQAERNEHPSTSRHQPSYSLYDKDQIRTSTSPRNIADARPSLATSCSSPNSSDVASAQFFQKSHSPRSSVSSYGDVVLPRAPESMLDRHIIAPLEQLRLADDHVEGGDINTSSLPAPRSPRRSTSVPGLRKADNAEGVPLPSSRRQTCSGESPSAGSSRPCSTTPSTCGSRHTSYQSPPGGQSRMADGTVSLSPPPRPSVRNSTRSGSVACSPSHAMGIKQQDGAGIGGSRQMDRTPSGQSDMTARGDSPELGRSRREQDRYRGARTQYMFRELDGSRRPPLSEREKTDIWNDLLARSDRAGGTLHINGTAELLSDSMRLSTFSDA